MTQTFIEKVCTHHRPMGTALQGVLRAKYKLGVKDYSVGNHPLWEFARTLYQMTRSPFVIGGLMLGAGYFVSFFRRRKTAVPDEIVRFVRREQIQRLKSRFKSLVVPAGRHIRPDRSA
jgi:hypothetical protein